MKIAILFSGLLRSFFNNYSVLYKQIKDSNNKYDVFIHCTNEDSGSNISHLHTLPGITGIMYDNISNITFPSIVNKFKLPESKIINTLKQWYKLQRIYSFLADPEKYDYIIRLRPDILLKDNIDKVVNTLEKSILYIPEGNDIYDSRIFKSIGEFKSINDQFCIGSPDVMKKYCNVYYYIQEYSHLPFI